MVQLFRRTLVGLQHSRTVELEVFVDCHCRRDWAVGRDLKTHLRGVDCLPAALELGRLGLDVGDFEVLEEHLGTPAAGVALLAEVRTLVLQDGTVGLQELEGVLGPAAVAAVFGGVAVDQLLLGQFEQVLVLEREPGLSGRDGRERPARPALALVLHWVDHVRGVSPVEGRWCVGFKSDECRGYLGFVLFLCCFRKFILDVGKRVRYEFVEV